MTKPIEGVSEKILACAKEEFLEKGYSEASLQDGSEITEEFVHITARAMFDSMFEVVRHRMDRDTARKYLHMLEKYHYGGWGAIIKLG